MKIKSLFLIACFILGNQNIFGQNDSLIVNKKRLLIAGTSIVGALGASYWYVQNSWWSDISNDFRFDPGNDLDIADHADWADACFLQSLK